MAILTRPHINLIQPVLGKFGPLINWRALMRFYPPVLWVGIKLGTYTPKAMERGNYFVKKSESGPLAKTLLRFISANFDWLALVVITLIILLVLVLF